MSGQCISIGVLFARSVANRPLILALEKYPTCQATPRLSNGLKPCQWTMVSDKYKEPSIQLWPEIIDCPY